MCTAFIFSGCNVIKTEISNPITGIFDEGGVDYKSFSEPAQKALYRIYSDHFFEATGINEDNFDDVVEYMKNLFSKVTSNSLEISALTNATFEDQIIQYDISTAQANAEAISYAVEKYSNKCAENKIAVKSGVHIYKLASESPEKEVKYNGSDSDLKLFINNVINYEARNGYCYIEINEYGAPVAVYWADKKSVFNNNDNLTSFYRWDIEEYQNGADLIGAYPASFSIVNIATSRIAEKTSVASKFSLSSLDFDEIEAGEVYDNLVEIFKEEIDDWINYFESFDSETSDMSYTKEQFEDMSSSNVNAKQVHTALASCATQASIYDIKIENAEITNNYDGDTDLLFGDYDPDLESYLGESFKGYYYVYLNPETYSVYFALWSEQPIPDSYKHQLSEDEQKKLWANDIRIGCYPLLSDTDMKIEEQHIDKNSSNANAKMVHTALSACATQAAIMDVEINDSEITNNYDGDVDLLFGDYDPELVSYLGDSFKGYYYVYLNTDTYSVYFALWSEQPIPDSYKYQFTEQEQIKLWEDGVRIGCYPLASN